MKKFILCLWIFVFSIAIGYYYSSLWKKQNVSISNETNTMLENVIETTAKTEEKVSYDADFALKRYYDKCGHFKFSYAELPVELVNLTEEEVKRIYDEWNVEEFSNDNIVLSQNIDDICDEHFVIKLGDENIEIFHQKNDDLELYKSTNISKKYLTSADISNLNEGIYVFGSGNLNSAIEDFE